jgi:hypothetical protein
MRVAYKFELHTSRALVSEVWAVRCEITDYNIMCARLVYSVYNNYITSGVIRLWVGRCEWFTSSREWEKQESAQGKVLLGSLSPETRIYTLSRYMHSVQCMKMQFWLELDHLCSNTQEKVNKVSLPNNVFFWYLNVIVRCVFIIETLLVTKPRKQYYCWYANLH